ncbi:hypothetical protein MVES1_001298 [Malassezia vespertilionis]|uniref:Uncharacterized protein n=1 Tax=Malassezia vespertilionis TaxID=2020962 RepID=A0A2N1JF23_9BASI|nr:uncharacterized protein MVES1_001298 [Malassezia vespertilionis]PKI85116.1 hypothetical protein MVES_001218 [Malassezia vespertilionis]WFD05960.1 hypothetical protein MVES1_001298 [Malassezia vespertilionis]
MPAKQFGHPAPLVQSKTLDFIESIPLVAEAEDYAFSALRDRPIMYRIYAFALFFIAVALKLAQPLIYALRRPLRMIDDHVLAFLETAKHQVPYPFEAHWSGLCKQAQTEVDAYKSSVQTLYENKVKEPYKNLYEQTNKAIEQLQQNENDYLQQAGNVLVSINDRLTRIVENWKKQSKKATTEGKNLAQEEIAEGEKQAQTLVQSLFTELDNLQKYASGVSGEGRKQLQPIIDTFSSTYKDISVEAFDSKLPIQERAAKVVDYLRQVTLPALQKALVATIHDAKENLPKYANKASKKVQEAEHNVVSASKQSETQAQKKMEDTRVDAAQAVSSSNEQSK